MNISSGKVTRPVKLVIYGAEGIGKSTLASKAPAPLFIDTEGGTAQMDVTRTERPESWEGLIRMIEEVAADSSLCKTLVLDTADWAEQLCITDVCTKYKKAGIEEFGYGKGYTYLSEEFARLLAAMDKVIAAGMNVIITAHAKMRKFEQPDEMGAYDRWEMKLSKQVAPLLKEWCDALLFLNYKTFVVTGANDTKKAQGGKRVMYASHHPCWDAKNRHGFPEEMDLDYSAIAALFADSTASTKTPYAQANVTAQKQKAENPDTDSALGQLKAKMLADHITDEELRQIVSKKGHFRFEVPISKYPDNFITAWILPNWGKIVDIIEADPNRLPF